MHRSDPIIFVMVGLPGSGKTTARSLLNAKFFVSSDWHIERLAKEQNSTYNEIFTSVVKEAAQELEKDVDLMIAMNASFIWDQTNLSVKKRHNILTRVPKHYIKVAVYMDVPLEKCLERNENRDRTIPEGVIKSMASQLEEPTIAEGFDHILTFDENSNIVNYEGTL